VQRYLFIDAGWTLVFPDCDLICNILRDHGYPIAEERLERTMAEVIYDHDELLGSGRRDWNTKGFFEWVLERAGVLAQHVSPIAGRLETLNAERSIWSTTRAWVRDALVRLDALGQRMSVISNADGRVAQELTQLGLAPFFEAVFDSHVVGFAKPDVRVFQHAMRELGLQPEDCVYVGDMYFIDVLGANRAGMASVQVDRYGLYDTWPGVRIPTVASLPDLLTGDQNWRSDAFFPLRAEG